uniref:Uncharacterized protein n=1 Tax=uncultured marine virus TaxID=186617 RepID=A0A0F7L686_9VIRU|nr:hypothetical protein [uncultured marine virus]
MLKIIKEREEEFNDKFSKLKIHNEIVGTCFRDALVVMQLEAHNKETTKLLLQAVVKLVEGKRKVVGTGPEAHCLTCHGHIAAGECDCDGYNLALAELSKELKSIISSI